MYSQIENTKGEKLYIFTISNTNSIKPYIYVNTWEKCLNKFKECTKELDKDSYFAQIINKNIREEIHKGEDLYIITVVSTNDIQPLIIISTWEDCMKKLEQITLEVDNDRFFGSISPFNNIVYHILPSFCI